MDNLNELVENQRKVISIYECESKEQARKRWSLKKVNPSKAPPARRA